MSQHYHSHSQRGTSFALIHIVDAIQVGSNGKTPYRTHFHHLVSKRDHAFVCRRHRLTQPPAQIRRDFLPEVCRLLKQGSPFRHILYFSLRTPWMACVVQSEARASSTRRYVWEDRGHSAVHQGNRHSSSRLNQSLTSSFSPLNRLLPMSSGPPWSTSPCPLYPSFQEKGPP
jgi:hypothetical protein